MFTSDIVEVGAQGLTKTLTLTRPFAKLRVITTDLYSNANGMPTGL